MRLDPATTLLCVVDVQERLLPTIANAAAVVARSTRLARAARLLAVPCVLTEQYPKGLGRTPPGLAEWLPPAVDKLAFSAVDAIERAAADRAATGPAIDGMLVCGLETHVCIAQTTLDLLARAYPVFVAVDAVAARHAIDHDTALRRLEGAGAVPITTEAVLFEWCRSASHPLFQSIRRLILEPEA